MRTASRARAPSLDEVAHPMHFSAGTVRGHAGHHLYFILFLDSSEFQFVRSLLYSTFFSSDLLLSVCVILLQHRLDI